MDFFFLVDIIVIFRTTYFDSLLCEEVTDGKQIAKNYLTGRFWIDFLAMIPIDYITAVTKLILIV